MIAQKILETRVIPIEYRERLIDDLPDDYPGSTRFQLSPVTSESVLHTIKNLWLDCSAGVSSEYYADSVYLLHNGISSFQKEQSTTTALLGFRADVRHAMKWTEVTLMVLTDFSKAFDTISLASNSQSPFSSVSWATYPVDLSL